MTTNDTTRASLDGLRAAHVRVGRDFTRQHTAESIGWAIAHIERLEQVEQAAHAVVADLERDYVRAVNAILACAEPGGPDWHRWQGHAEAYRTAAATLRIELGMPPVNHRSDEWRAANGVYSEATIASWRR